MSEGKKYKRVVIKGCVVDGQNVNPNDEVKLSLGDCRYCDGAGLTADPSTDQGKELIAALPKKAKTKAK